METNENRENSSKVEFSITIKNSVNEETGRSTLKATVEASYDGCSAGFIALESIDDLRALGEHVKEIF